MFQYLILRDRRLSGSLGLIKSMAITCNLDASTPLSSAFSRTGTAVSINRGKLHTIFILCHGYAGSNDRAMMSMDAGGMGLQLGTEGIMHDNVQLWQAIKDKTENIVVYSCAASNTERGNEGTTADGRYLMGALAIHTNATVYAADRIQWYDPSSYDFGAWEGTLYRFPPSGEPGTRVTRPPKEFGEI